jgi:hypothetical protein
MIKTDMAISMNFCSIKVYSLNTTGGAKMVWGFLEAVAKASPVFVTLFLARLLWPILTPLGKVAVAGAWLLVVLAYLAWG